MSFLQDITRNLPSLQFEAAVKDEEKCLLFFLRTKSLAVSSSACGQAAYLVSILNEARIAIFEKSNVKSLHNKPCKIGIIGCGRLGKQLATVFLELANIDPKNLFISTRCPENLVQFETRGVICCFDNKMVSNTVDVLFLCCLPSQLNTVAKDLRGNLDCLVYSLIGGMSFAKISQLLDYQKIIKPNFIFKSVDQEKSDSNPCSFGRDITEILQDPISCQHTSPLYSNEGSLLEEDGKLCELFALVFLNQCTALGIGNNEAMRLCNVIMFGLEMGHTSCLNAEDVLQDYVEMADKEYLKNGDVFPVFNLTEVYSMSESSLGKKICQSNGVLRKAFVKKYTKVFENRGGTFDCSYNNALVGVLLALNT